MKYVTTLYPHEVLVVEQDDEGRATRTVSAIPEKVSNADADRYEQLGADHGVYVVVTDADELEDAAPPAGAQLNPTPDLSEGVGSVHGTGDPVVNDANGVVTDDPKAADKGATTRKKG